MGKEWPELHRTENLPRITVDDVQQELPKINVDKAPGPNDPLLKILKIIANYFAVPLTEIFNESFLSKNFPKVWKEYKVSGIPTSVPCTLAEDLRPIALTSVLARNLLQLSGCMKIPLGKFRFLNMVAYRDHRQFMP